MHETRGPERDGERESGSPDLSEGSLPRSIQSPESANEAHAAEPAETGSTEDAAPEAGKAATGLTRRQWLGIGLGALFTGGAAGLIYKAAERVDFEERKRIAVLELIATSMAGRDITPIVERLTPPLKEAVAKDVVDIMRGIEPHDLPTSCRWQAHAKIISLLDPDTYAAELSERSRLFYGVILSDLDEWRKTPEKLAALDGALRQIHQTMAFLPEDTRRMGEAKINSYERELFSRHSGLVPTYVDDLVGKIDRLEILKKERATSLLGGELEESGLFRKERGSYIYEHTSDDGVKSAWVLECRSPLDGLAMTFRNRDVMEKMFSIEPKEFVERVSSRRGFGDLVARAEEHYASEIAGAVRLWEYDFPEEGAISYVRVFPRFSDPVVSSDLFSSMMRACALKERYEDRLSVSPILHTDDPLGSLREELRRQHRGGRGPAFFCVDISNHGEPDYIAFEEKLTARDLAGLVKEFPDCKFAIRTFACFGGGLRDGFLEEMGKDPDLRDRVDVFVQTKPDLYNRVTVIASSPYDLYLIQSLYDDEVPTFGAAVMTADLKAKLLTELDAESIIGGQLIAEREKDGGRRLGPDGIFGREREQNT